MNTLVHAFSSIHLSLCAYTPMFFCDRYQEVKPGFKALCIKTLIYIQIALQNSMCQFTLDNDILSSFSKLSKLY